MKKVMKKILAMALVVMTVMSVVVVVPMMVGAAESGTAERVIEIARSFIGSTTYAGRCLAFVNDVYVAAGVNGVQRRWTPVESKDLIVSTSRDNIPIAALLYYDTAGKNSIDGGAGHIALYIGNGKIIDNGGTNGAIAERNITWDRYLGYGFSGAEPPRQGSSGGGSDNTGGGNSNTYADKVNGAKCLGERITNGQVINKGEYIASPNKKFIAIMQQDGNFVLYNTNRVLWHSETYDKSADCVILQNDGNIVIYSTSGKVLWTSNIRSAGELKIQDDGNLVAYEGGGKAVWSTFTDNKGNDGGTFNIPVTRADDIGNDFYAFIINGGNMLTNDNGATKFQAEKRDKSQIMRFQRNADDGTYCITAMSNGSALDVQEGNKKTSRVYFYSSLHKMDNQRFRIEKNGDKYMLGIKSGPELVLDSAGQQGNFSDGSQMWAYSRNDTSPQWYEIRKIDDVNAYLNPPATLTSIAIATKPTKTVYGINEILDTSGLSLTAKYSDNTTKSITSGFTCSPTILDTVGTQTIIVTYEDKTTSFTVNVTESTSNSTAGLINGIILTATVTEVGVKFDWTPNNNALGYRIFRSKISGGEGISITDFPITAKDGDYAGQYVDVNVDPETQYYYTICELTKEASFDSVKVEIIPEELGRRGEELAVYTDIVQTLILPEIDDDSETGKPKKHYMMMTVDSPTMLNDDIVKEIDLPGMNTTPIIKNGRTLAPIRVIVETMGGNVGWTETDSKVTLSAYDKTLELWIGHKKLYINGLEKEMDIAPEVRNGRTMLPLRFVSENVGCQIAWIGSTRQIIIVYYTFDE